MRAREAIPSWSDGAVAVIGRREDALHVKVVASAGYRRAHRHAGSVADGSRQAGAGQRSHRARYHASGTIATGMIPQLPPVVNTELLGFERAVGWSQRRGRNG